MTGEDNIAALLEDELSDFEETDDEIDSLSDHDHDKEKEDQGESSVSVSPPSRSCNFRPSVERIPQPPAADPTPPRLRLDYFRSVAGKDIDTYIQPPQPPEALSVALVESTQSRFTLH